jgi:hypothetical protein
MKNSYCWYSLLTVNKQVISEDTKQVVMDEIESNPGNNDKKLE